MRNEDRVGLLRVVGGFFPVVACGAVETREVGELDLRSLAKVLLVFRTGEVIELFPVFSLILADFLRLPSALGAGIASSCWVLRASLDLARCPFEKRVSLTRT